MLILIPFSIGSIPRTKEEIEHGSKGVKIHLWPIGLGIVKFRSPICTHLRVTPMLILSVPILDPGKFLMVRNEKINSPGQIAKF